MELIRTAAIGGDDTRGPRDLRAVAAGALTALVGWVLPVVLVVLGALAVPRASAGVGEAIGSGSLLWLVLGGARLHLGAGSLALTPLLGTALLLLVARTGARRGLPAGADLRLQGAWLGGYVAVAALAVLTGLLSPAAPVASSLVLPLLLLPATGLLWAHGLPERAEDAWLRVPWAMRRALAPAAKGGLLLVLLGGVLVLVSTLVHLGRVWHIQAGLEAGFFGGLVLVLLQVCLVPNLGIWALSFAAGPGFSTADGAMTTWSGAEAGLLPMVPVLAAQPQPGGLPWVTHLLVLVPIGAGAWMARRSLARMPRLTATRTKLAVVSSTVVIAAVIVVLLDALAGGSLGAVRLGDLGAPAVPLLLTLTAELALGALVVLVRDWWVLRR